MEISQELIKGTVVPILLRLLDERSMYGYEIIKVVNERTENAFAWKEGTVYPWLHRLEGEGLIASHWEDAGGRRRKYYSTTRKGRARLKQKVDEWQTFTGAVNALLLPPATA